MNAFERTLRLLALPLAISIAITAMWWIWATYPQDEDFFLERVLPFYSLYLVLTAASMGAVSGQIKTFLIIVTSISAMFILEIFLRVMFGIFII